MSEKFSVEQVTEAIEAAVAEKGEDYVYERREDGNCNYLTYEGAVRESMPTGPSCIVGSVLVRLGVPLVDLVDCEGARARSILASFGITDGDIVDGLDRAQMKQDNGETWGAALKAYKVCLR